MREVMMKRACYLLTLQILGLLLLLSAVFMVQGADAHRLNIFVSEAEAQGDGSGSHAGQGLLPLHVEGYFADGKPAMKSRVRVLGRNGDLLAEAVTDKQGIAEIQIPLNRVKRLKAEGRPLKIELIASPGHRAEISYLPDWSRWGEVKEVSSSKGGGSQHFHRHPIETSTLLREAALGTGLIVLFFLGLYCIRKIHAVQGQIEG
jgi:hypothetical protein